MRCVPCLAPAADAARQEVKDEAADQPLCFAFAGCGFLMPYFNGACEVLEDAGVLREGCSFIGTSSGG